MTTNTTITPELLDQLLANYEKPEDLTGDGGLWSACLRPERIVQIRQARWRDGRNIP
jgi:hypothetical protein